MLTGAPIAMDVLENVFFHSQKTKNKGINGLQLSKGKIGLLLHILKFVVIILFQVTMLVIIIII